MSEHLSLFANPERALCIQGLTPLHVAALHGERQHAMMLERMGCTPTEPAPTEGKPQRKGFGHQSSQLFAPIFGLPFGGNRHAGQAVLAKEMPVSHWEGPQR